jgi:hypothetical protein
VLEFHSEQLLRIPSYVTLPECESLYALTPKDGTVAEIGVGRGRSLIAMALKGATVVGVSLWNQVEEGTYHDVRENLNQFPSSLRERVVLIHGESSQTGRLMQRRLFDLVFVDGGHDEDQVYADVLAWTPTLKPYGFLAFHDYGGNWPGVDAVVSNLLERGEWIAVSAAGYLIALQRRDPC